MNPRMDAHGLTRVGVERARNEDQFLIARLDRSMHVDDASLDLPLELASRVPPRLLVVADGIGGLPGGEHASDVAVQTVARTLLEAAPTDPRDALERAVEGGEARVRALAREGELDARAMGTTLTLAYVAWPHAWIAHVGDSRCSLFRGERLIRITRDHTVAQRLLDDGVIDEATASRSRWRHVLAQALGTEREGVRPDIHELELRAGDRLLLSSDGLTDVVDEEEIAAVLSAEGDDEAACTRLLERALASGGRDDVTVIVASFRDACRDDARGTRRASSRRRAA